MSKKLLSLLVAALMVLSLVPAAAFASSETAKAPVSVKETQVLLWDFETDPLEDGWLFVDADGDGYNWGRSSLVSAHSGTYMIASASYDGGALSPDNWAFTPVVTLPDEDQLTLRYFVRSYSASYPETYRIYVGTDTNIESMEPVTEDLVSPANTSWAEVTADLSDYAGQTVYLAFRHYNCYDRWRFFIDDVEIFAGEAEPPVTEAPVTPVPTTQPPVTNPPVTNPPVTNPPSDGDVWDFEQDPEAQGFIFQDQDGDGNNWEWRFGSDWADFNYHEGQGYMMSASYINYVGALTPDNWMITPEFSGTGLTFWAQGQDASYAEEYLGIFVSTDGGSTWGSQIEGFTLGGSDTQYTVDLTDYEGQNIKVAIRHYNVTDMFQANVDYIEIQDSEDEPTDPTVIDVIEINDFVEPVYGENPFFNCTVPAGANYSISYTDWNWYDEATDDGDILEPTDVFDNENYVYYQYFTVLPNEGYEFSDNTTVLINGDDSIAENYGWSSYGSYFWIYTIDFTVEEPAPAIDLDEALNVEGGTIHFVSNGDYPWFGVEDEETGRLYAMSGNTGVHSTDSILIANITANEGDVVTFEFKAWGEGTSTFWDYCEFAIDGQRQGYWGALQNEEWETFTSEPMTAGEHTLTWTYHKDSSVNKPGDYFAVDNVEITEGELPPTGIIGDVDLDGDVDTADALMALRYVMGLIDLTDAQLAQAEVTGDDNVSIADPLLILRKAMGVIDYFPIEN